MDDLHTLSIMVGDKWKIDDYVYIHVKTGSNLEGTSTRVNYKIKLHPQEVINLKFGLKYNKICPDSINYCIYKIVIIKKYKIRCEEISYEEK